VGQPTPAGASSPIAGRRGRGDRTRAALVDAATELFAAKGVEATSVDEITARAAVAKGTFYVHFQRKQDVLLEQSARFVDRLAGDPALVDAADATTALEALARLTAARMWSDSRPLIARAIREMIGNREQWVRVLGDRPTLGAIIEPVIERGRADGAIRADLSPARLAQGLTILWLDAILGWAERAEERDLVQDLLRSLSLYLDGARVR
jgi:AcrR family transcriptional regulator